MNKSDTTVVRTTSLKCHEEDVRWILTSSQQRRLTAARYSMRAHSLSLCFRKRGNCFLQLFPRAQGKISYFSSSSSSSMVFARYL